MRSIPLLICLALTACAAAPTQPSQSGVPVRTPPSWWDQVFGGVITTLPTPVVSPHAPTAGGPLVVLASPSTTPTPVPSDRVPCTIDPTTVIVGQVEDADGHPLDGALVMATSLDPNKPYSASVATVAGKWVINNVLEDARIRFEASKPGYATRTQELTIGRYGDCGRHELDFALTPAPTATP